MAAEITATGVVATTDQRTAADTAPRRPSRRRRRIGSYALLTFSAVVVLLPVYVTIVLAIQPGNAALTFPRALIPADLDLGVFARAFDLTNLQRYLVNSAIVALLITAAQVVTSILAAYAFAELRFPGRNALFVAFLATLMIPAEVTIVANFDTIVWLGWLDSYQGLVVPFMATAFGTFLIRQSFMGIPQDLRDAARLDGYGHLGFLWSVAVPLARPAIAALSVFSFLAAWNQYTWPRAVVTEGSWETIQIALKGPAAPSSSMPTAPRMGWSAPAAWARSPTSTTPTSPVP
ncbi:MAG TPA: carbohydrate ABC transporter permease [Acidimicrobiales bacterium]|nr:carbohydrate ABC transporter permease [Acidimicrobiales bacterium]